MNCVRSNESLAPIWSRCGMNGTNSAPIAAATPRVSDVKVTDDTLTVDLEDGRTISVPIGFYPRLAHASATERGNFVISGAGFGIHWPDLDEDLGVEGLLQGRRSTEGTESLKRWLA